jgi:ribosomal protein S18 acetylase RimI-like enzyme
VKLDHESDANMILNEFEVRNGKKTLNVHPITKYLEQNDPIIKKELCMKMNGIKVIKREDLPALFFNCIANDTDWFYGYLNKSHYLIDDRGIIVGCLNIIYLINYERVVLFYMDTIEIREECRRQKLGTTLVNHVISCIKNKYKDFYIFLLVAKCAQYKLKFFSKLGFIPVKLRKTNKGSHCIMSYPFDDNSEKNCKRMFEYFCWREEKKEIISSDCKFAYNPNPIGLYWCGKKKIYVTGLEKQDCPFYLQDKEIVSDKKFLDLQDYMF